MKSKTDFVNFITGVLVIVLSLAVSIPLTIKAAVEGGGRWGFGVIGLPVLISVSFYILLGAVALIKSARYQQITFLITHFILFGTSAIIMFVFPVYPTLLVSVPLMLAVCGLITYKRYKHYLLIMLFLAIAANVLLLKWELDFHRSVPIIQLFNM